MALFSFWLFGSGWNIFLPSFPSVSNSFFISPLLPVTHSTGTVHQSSLPVVWQRQRLFDSVTTVMYDCFHPSTHPKLIIMHQIGVTYLYISLCPIQSTSLPVFPESYWLPVCVLILFSFSTSTPDCPLSFFVFHSVCAKCATVFPGGHHQMEHTFLYAAESSWLLNTPQGDTRCNKEPDSH